MSTYGTHMAVDPIVALLAERRKALRLSQDKLADLAGVTQSMISAYECGHGVMNLVTLRKLCAALDVDLFAVANPVPGLEARWAA